MKKTIALLMTAVLAFATPASVLASENDPGDTILNVAGETADGEDSAGEAAAASKDASAVLIEEEIDDTDEEMTVETPGTEGQESVDDSEANEITVENIEVIEPEYNTEEDPAEADAIEEEYGIALLSAGNTLDTATSISAGTSYSGTITSTNTEDFYKFTLSTSGSVELTFTGYMERVSYRFYDSDGKSLIDTYEYWNSTTQKISLDRTIDLTSGTYYLDIGQRSGYTGSYTFKLTFTSANESFKEGNGGSDNMMETADSISAGTKYYGQIALNDTEDFYKFTLSTSGSVELTVTGYMERLNYRLYDSDGKSLIDTYEYWNSTTQKISLNRAIDLTSGTYYLNFGQRSGYTGNYFFELTFTSAKESFKEGNGGSDNMMETANSISLGTTYNGQIALNDTEDFYKFTLSKSGSVELKMTGYMERVNYRLYDSSGKSLLDSYQYWDSTTQKISLDKTIDLSAGTYYLDFGQRSGYTGNYSFKVKDTSAKSSSSSGSSSSSSTSSTLKKGSTYTVGKFKYKITSLPSSGTGKVTVKAPASTSITKAAIPAKVTISGRSFKVTKIGAKAFKGCKKLKTVTVGKNVTTIGNQAFQGCTKMTGISIKTGLTAIGKKAFYNCKSLKTIQIKSKNLTSVGKNAFKGIKSNATIKVPSSKLSAYKKLLNGKGQGSKVKITS